ncbi:MAG: hypothetical protein ABIA74_03250 [bacterium]
MFDFSRKVEVGKVGIKKGSEGIDSLSEQQKRLYNSWVEKQEQSQTKEEKKEEVGTAEESHEELTEIEEQDKQAIDFNKDSSIIEKNDQKSLWQNIKETAGDCINEFARFGSNAIVDAAPELIGDFLGMAVEYAGEDLNEKHLKEYNSRLKKRQSRIRKKPFVNPTEFSSANEAKLYYATDYPEELIPKRNSSGHIIKTKKRKKNDPLRFKSALEANLYYTNHPVERNWPKNENTGSSYFGDRRSTKRKVGQDFTDERTTTSTSTQFNKKFRK